MLLSGLMIVLSTGHFVALADRRNSKSCHSEKRPGKWSFLKTKKWELSVIGQQFDYNLKDKIKGSGL
jgi:hypothetical protein